MPLDWPRPSAEEEKPPHIHYAPRAKWSAAQISLLDQLAVDGGQRLPPVLDEWMVMVDGTLTHNIIRDRGLFVPETLVKRRLTLYLPNGEKVEHTGPYETGDAIIGRVGVTDIIVPAVHYPEARSNFINPKTLPSRIIYKSGESGESLYYWTATNEQFDSLLRTIYGDEFALLNFFSIPTPAPGPVRSLEANPKSDASFAATFRALHSRGHKSVDLLQERFQTATYGRIRVNGTIVTTADFADLNPKDLTCPTCEAVGVASWIRPRTSIEAQGPGEILYATVVEFPPLGIKDARYMLTVIDDFSRYAWVFFSAQDTAGHVLPRLGKLIALLNAQFGEGRVKIIRSNGTDSFSDVKALNYYEKRGIKYETLAPNYHYEVIADFYNTVLAVARVNKHQGDIPDIFWPFLLDYSSYICNVLIKRPRPGDTVQLTADELLTGASASLEALFVFGSSCYLRSEKLPLGRQKVGLNRPAIYLRPLIGGTGFLAYDLGSAKTVTSRSPCVLEGDFEHLKAAKKALGCPEQASLAYMYDAGPQELARNAVSAKAGSLANLGDITESVRELLSNAQKVTKPSPYEAHLLAQEIRYEKRVISLIKEKDRSSLDLAEVASDLKSARLRSNALIRSDGAQYGRLDSDLELCKSHIAFLKNKLNLIISRQSDLEEHVNGAINHLYDKILSLNRRRQLFEQRQSPSELRVPARDRYVSNGEGLNPYYKTFRTKLMQLAGNKTSPLLFDLQSSDVPPLSGIKKAQESIFWPFWMRALDSKLTHLDKLGVLRKARDASPVHTLSADWTFKAISNKLGQVESFDAVLVLKGLDADDSFQMYSPTKRYGLFRLAMATATIESMHAHHLDVRRAFLHPKLQAKRHVKIVGLPNEVYELATPLPGIQQGSPKWFKFLRGSLAKLGFKETPPNSGIHRRGVGPQETIVFTFEDDILVLSRDLASIQEFKDQLEQYLYFADLEEVSDFQGLRIRRDMTSQTTELSVDAYIEEALSAYGLETCRTFPKPLPMASNFDVHSPPLSPKNRRRYHQLVGTLRHIAAIARPDITQAVHKLERHSKPPNFYHLQMAERVYGYLKGSRTLSIVYRNDPAYVSYAGFDLAPADGEHQSVVGGLVKYAGAPVLWTSSILLYQADAARELDLIALWDTSRLARKKANVLKVAGLSVDSKLPARVYTSGSWLVRAVKEQTQEEGVDPRLITRIGNIRKLCEDFELLPAQASDLLADIVTKQLPEARFRELVAGIGLRASSV